MNLAPSGFALRSFHANGGEGRIRTYVDVSQRIYSPSPLATRAPLQGKWSWLWDSNPQPADYKSAALPIELNQHRLTSKIIKN